MKRQFPGLHSEAARAEDALEGIFLVRVDRAYYRWHPQKNPSSFSASQSSNRKTLPHARFRDGCIALKNLSGSSTGFCGISVMTRTCSEETRWTKRPSSVSRGSFEPPVRH